MGDGVMGTLGAPLVENELLSSFRKAEEDWLNRLL